MNSDTTQFYTGLIDSIKQLIGSDEFKQRHRSAENAFSRTRILVVMHK